MIRKAKDLPSRKKKRNTHIDTTRRQSEPCLFFDMSDFLRYLNDYFDYVDVITFTLSQHHLFNVRKVITNKLLGDRMLASQIRINDNVHSKVFLCFKNLRLRCVYVGSFNLTMTLNHNVMVLVDHRSNKTFQTYFHELWQMSTPLQSLSTCISPIKQKL